MLLSLIVYNLLVLFLAPIWAPAIVWRNVRRGRPPFGGRFLPEDRRALAGKRVIWLHCVSMGESGVGARLYRRLSPLLPGMTWVFTTTTPTGQATLHRLLDGAGPIRYFPIDLPWPVRGALRAVRPELLVLVETELWPNLIYWAHRHGAKVALVNGRISDRSMRGVSRLRWLLRPILSRIDLLLMQTALDAERIVRVGAPRERVRVSGNIKFDLEPAVMARLDREVLGLAPGPILVAGSTHRGEEEVLLKALALIRAQGPAGLVVAPRHLERLPEVRALLAASGVRWGLRSEPASSPREVLLVDTYGELPSFYRLATAAFVGGSLVPIGGHNPVEPSSLGRPVLFGPHMENFREARALLLEAGAAREVRSAEEIATAFRTIVADPAGGSAMGERGRAVVAASRGAAERTAAWMAALVGSGHE